MDKVKKEFEKLIDQGKINKAKGVEATEGIDYLAKGIMCKTIKYNPQINESPEEYIDFYLLHEEGHFVNPVKGIECVFLIISLLLIVAVTLLGCFSTIPLLAHFSIIPVNLLFASGLGVMFFLIFLFIHIWLIYVYQKYEYSADDYACKHVDDPLIGISALSALSALNRRPVKKIDKWKGYVLIVLGANYAHPSMEKRINRIKKDYQ